MERIGAGDVLQGNGGRMSHARFFQHDFKGLKMSENSKIQWTWTEIAWTDDTWNGWIGCAKVSPGRANCYAEVSTPTRMARTNKATFEAPLGWNGKPWICDACGTAQALPSICPECWSQEKVGTATGFHRRRVFSLSLGDWLDPDVPIDWLAEMLNVIHRCPHLDFLLLTKRPENFVTRVLHAGMEMMGCFDGQKSTKPEALPTVTENVIESVLGWSKGETFPPNVWIGTTCEDQTRADERIPHLLRIPAKIRFVSYEPALGPVDFEFALPWKHAEIYNPIIDKYVNWVIVGGEIGAHARPFNLQWARDTVMQCADAGATCYVKQLGSHPIIDEAPPHGWPIGTVLGVGAKTGLGRPILRDKNGGDMSEWPIDLRVRQFPA